MTELTDDELFTVWDEHYADVVSCDRPPLDYEFFRAIIAADHARQAPAPAEVSRLAELRREVERLSLYEILATEYGLSVFAESAQVIEELRREVALLTEERNAAFAMSRCECAASEFCAQLVAAETEVEALRADAERYRWLRNNPPTSLCVRQDRATAFNTTAVYIDGQNLDAAIDAARASTDEGVGK